MQAKTHLAAGLLVGILVSIQTKLNLESSFILSVASMIGSLIPDIDHPRSTLGSKIKPISTGISKVFGHRGITHSLLMVFLLWFLMISYHLGVVYEGIIVGYSSHLFGDWLTVFGIPLFWPLRRKFSSPLAFKTGKGFEKFVFVILTMLIINFGYILVQKTY